MSKKTCFVISPIGAEGSAVRNRADLFLEYIVKPALSDEFEVSRADEIAGSEIITQQIILEIESADLVVADLTDHNPNVFYELGLRHMKARPAILMIQEGQTLPFDVNAVRAIHYSLANPVAYRSAIENLQRFTRVSLDAPQVSNPVTAARGYKQLRESVDPSQLIIANLADGLARLEGEVEELRATVDEIADAPPSFGQRYADALASGESRRTPPTPPEVKQAALEKALEQIERAFGPGSIMKLDGAVRKPDK